MKLTRKLVLAKAKASDLESVRKLNCWGCNLTDISIFSEIPNVEVLTLSDNKITSLSPFSGCMSLTELYLRRNMIQSLSELTHLRPLTHLRVLWLAENPCCGGNTSQYRLAVLRCLPGLHKLDDQVVTEDEVAFALTEGEEILAPPDIVTDQPARNGHQDADTETDPLNYNMEETNKIRQELGMKPLSRDKFPSVSSPLTRTSIRKNHTLDAILLLLKDLDEEELRIVNTATHNRLQTYTLGTDTMRASQQSLTNC
ncbi:cilia and flagella associated protein 410 [Synchiropus picturatus]